MRLEALALALCCAAGSILGANLDEDASLAAVRKFRQIAERSLPSGSTVEFSEHELNAFLRFHGSPMLPPGVNDSELDLRSGGAEFRARIDLERVGSVAEKLPLMMRLLLRGTRSVAADLDYSVIDGRATAEIVRLTIEGVEIPPEVLDWLLEAYAPPELRTLLSADGQAVEIGISDLRIREDVAVATVE